MPSQFGSLGPYRLNVIVPLPSKLLPPVRVAVSFNRSPTDPESSDGVVEIDGEALITVKHSVSLLVWLAAT